MGVIVGSAPALGQEGAVEVEKITTPVHQGNAVEHVNTAEEKVVGVDQIIIDLRILTCDNFMENKLILIVYLTIVDLLLT